MTTEMNINPKLPILLVDDEAPIVKGYEMTLKRAGYTNMIACASGQDAIKTILTTPVDLVLLDLNMPNVSGEEVLDEIVQSQPDVPVIIVTGRTDVESAVACMRSGAHDYLVKTASRDRIVTSVKNALLYRNLQRENNRLSEACLGGELKHSEVFSEIITGQNQMLTIFKYIEAIGDSSFPVLITGETGTGKELIAKAIHLASARQGEFVAVNVAGLDDNVFSDTIFGHRKGAFTGADQVRNGMIETAAGGTLFLDEIGDLSAQSQSKLLRLLQEKEYLPLGADKPSITDARIITATNRDLAQRQKDGSFRPDLFFRLNTHKIALPPLRQRIEDMPLLLDHFIGKAAEQLGKKKPTAPPMLSEMLKSYAFPGNIRELEAMVVDAVSRHVSKMLSMSTFKEHIGQARDGAEQITVSSEDVAAAGKSRVMFEGELPSMKNVKRILIDEALRRSNGKKGLAANMLGVTRQALNWHLRQRDPDQDG